MTEKVSTLIIAQPKNWNDAWAATDRSVAEYMRDQFPEYEFEISACNPFQMPDRFGLIPIAGRAGERNGCMFEPVPAETMEEMYDALARYGARPTVN